MSDRTGIFAGDDPFVIARAWLNEAGAQELNDPNAMALATVDESGMPNSRMVLLKEIEGRAQTGPSSSIPTTARPRRVNSTAPARRPS